MTTIADNWRAVKARVDAACRAAGREPGEVTIIAVSKLHPASAVREAAAAGASDFGENYAQELAGKRAECGDVRWHFIGRLQRNKAKLVAGQVALVHAVDDIGEQRLAPVHMVGQEMVEMVAHGIFDQTRGVGAGQAVLGLALELGIADEDRQHDFR